MASRHRARGPRTERTSKQLSDLGIFNIPDFDVEAEGDDSDVDENDLETELEAILAGGSKSASKTVRPKQKDTLDIKKMTALCMKDIDEDEGDDEDISDPDLLKELQGLSCESPGPEDVSEGLHAEIPENIPESNPLSHKSAVDIITVLDQRLKHYHNAVAGAKAVNDQSKVRRYGRAVKRLENLIKSAKDGGVINEEDIPPLPMVNIFFPKASRAPLKLPYVTDHDSPTERERDATSNMSFSNLSAINISCDTETPKEENEGDEKNNGCKTLMERRDQYRIQALHAKRAGDKASAVQYIKISKSLDAVIEALNNGESVDLSTVPPPPEPYEAPIAAKNEPPVDPKKEHDETQASSAIEAAALSAASEPEDPTFFAAPPAPTSVLEALEQRLIKYNSTKAAAEAEGNSGKIRRLQRIINSYEKAIKDHKAGKNVDFNELPTPPGFAPIPSQTCASEENSAKEKVPVQDKGIAEAHTNRTSTVTPKRTAPQVPSQNTERQKPKVQRTNTSTFDKKLEFLLERQKMFRQAAITSKKSGDIQQAKEYLRMSKGFDSMIEATKCGLPIDASSIPTPPQLDSDFVIVDISECGFRESEGDSGNNIELLETLEKDLLQQIEVCSTNREHFLKLGDVSSASKFEKLGLESKKDLSVIRHLQKTGIPAPKFHYETRLFSVVQCHTDLADNDLIVIVERGISLPGKAHDLDSYVRLDFPIPSEAPQRAKTHTVKDTNNPIFQEEFKFEINRKSRAQLRLFKRQALKLEIWSKGGFLRSDTLIGTVNVPLRILESKCTIHDCFDLMDGRKACGGKLEVKVKIRQPLLVKQVEEVREKWLVIGS